MLRHGLFVIALLAAPSALAASVELRIASGEGDGFDYSAFRAADDSWVQTGLAGSLLAPLPSLVSEVIWKTRAPTVMVRPILSTDVSFPRKGMGRIFDAPGCLSVVPSCFAGAVDCAGR